MFRPQQVGDVPNAGSKPQWPSPSSRPATNNETQATIQGLLFGVVLQILQPLEMVLYATIVKSLDMYLLIALIANCLLIVTMIVRWMWIMILPA